MSARAHAHWYCFCLTEHVVAEHARGERSHALPLQLLVHELALTSEWPAVDVQDEHLLAQLLCELWLSVQVVHVAILVGEVGGINWVQYGAVEGFYDGGHGRVFLDDRDILRAWKPVDARRSAQLWRVQYWLLTL